MSRKNKLKRFEEMRRFPNCFQNFSFETEELTGCNGQPVTLNGKWGTDYFQNQNPITLELACGGGEYTVGLAGMYPDRNFIGVDIKGARMFKGASKALEAGLKNVAFLRTRIERLAIFLAPEEVDEIWITFPDPFLKESRANRRLTSPPFLRIYERILKTGGILHLKTDETQLYHYSKEILGQEPNWTITLANEDIYRGPMTVPEWEIKTHYEIMHLGLGKSIKYLSARLNNRPDNI
jgi:tRNA (guanine-N7-)-methyltransferase